MKNRGTFLDPTRVPHLWMACSPESFSALCSIGNSTGVNYHLTSESLGWKACLVKNAASVSPASLRCTSFEWGPGRTCSRPGLLKAPVNKPTAFCAKSRSSSAAWFLTSGGRGAKVAVRRLYTMGRRRRWGEKRYRTLDWRRWNSLSRGKGCHRIPQMIHSEERKRMERKYILNN